MLAAAGAGATLARLLGKRRRRGQGGDLVEMMLPTTTGAVLTMGRIQNGRRGTLVIGWRCAIALDEDRGW